MKKAITASENCSYDPFVVFQRNPMIFKSLLYRNGHIRSKLSAVRIHHIHHQPLRAGSGCSPLDHTVGAVILETIPLVIGLVVDDKLVVVLAAAAQCLCGEGHHITGVHLIGGCGERTLQFCGSSRAVYDYGHVLSHTLSGAILDVYHDTLGACSGCLPFDGVVCAVILQLIPLVVGSVVDDKLVLVVAVAAVAYSGKGDDLTGVCGGLVSSTPRGTLSFTVSVHTSEVTLSPYLSVTTQRN